MTSDPQKLEAASEYAAEQRRHHPSASAIQPIYPEGALRTAFVATEVRELRAQVSQLIQALHAALIRG
jgi:uncharacterized protein YukE